MAIPVVADGAQAAWEDMAKVAPHKLRSGDRPGFEAIVGAVFGEESDAIPIEGKDALIANHAACDISAEIAEGMGSVAGGLDVNAPFFGPDGGIDLPALGCDQAAKLLAEGGF